MTENTLKTKFKNKRCRRRRRLHCSLSKSVTYSNLTTSSRQAKSLSNISCDTTYSNRSKAKTIYHLGASKGGGCPEPYPDSQKKRIGRLKPDDEQLQRLQHPIRPKHYWPCEESWYKLKSNCLVCFTF